MNKLMDKKVLEAMKVYKDTDQCPKFQEMDLYLIDNSHNFRTEDMKDFNKNEKSSLRAMRRLRTSISIYERGDTSEYRINKIAKESKDVSEKHKKVFASFEILRKKYTITGLNYFS